MTNRGPARVTQKGVVDESGHDLRRLLVAGLRDDRRQPGRRPLPIPAPTVLIVDDHAPKRRALRGWLADAYDLEEADGVASARAQLAAARPDALLLELHLGDGHGSTLLPDISPTTAIVVMSAELAEDDFARLQNRPDAFLHASHLSLVCSFIERALTIRRAHPDAVFARFADHFRLAPMERRVAHLAWNGHDDHRIAHHLGLSRAAIESTWKRIYNKTGSRRAQLDALRRGWDPARDGPFHGSGTRPVVREMPRGKKM
jgi:DNA-binding NarL/FixJ family response regulator